MSRHREGACIVRTPFREGESESVRKRFFFVWGLCVFLFLPYGPVPVESNARARVREGKMLRFQWFLCDADVDDDGDRMAAVIQPKRARSHAGSWDFSLKHFF